MKTLTDGEHNSRRRFLAITLDAAGNWPPLRELMRTLAQRGHDVRVITDARHAAEVAEIGARYRPYLLAPERILSRFEFPQGQVDSAQSELDFALKEILFNASFGRELLAEIEHDRPEVLLIDFMLTTAFVAAESARLPTVNLVHTPYAFVPQLMNAPAGQSVEQFNRLRSELHLPSVSAPPDVLKRCAATLAFTFEEFDLPPAERPHQLHYVGPLACLPRTVPEYDLPWPADDARPLIVVSYSTSFQNQVNTLQRVADAVASIRARVLFTLGAAIRSDELQLPANAVAMSFVPHAAVLPRARLVVTHAGHGTVMAAAVAGVPVVCTPMGRDQHAVSACVERCGIGVSLPATASSVEIRQTIEQALSDQALRARCREFAAGLDLNAGPQRAIDVLESI